MDAGIRNVSEPPKIFFGQCNYVKMMRPPEPPIETQKTKQEEEVVIKKEPNNNTFLDCEDLESVEDYDEKIIFVRTRKVGYLIGTSGRTIRGFESNSGAKIDILKPNSDADETPILLSGTSESVRNVLRMIIDLYHLNNLSSSMWQHLRNKGSYENEEGKEQIHGHEEIRVESAFVTQIQKSLVDIESETGAHVEVGKESEEDPGFVFIGVIGTAEQNFNAMKKVEELHAKFLAEVKEIKTDNKLDPFDQGQVRFRTTPRNLTTFENYKENLILSTSIEITHAFLHPICKLNNVIMETHKDDESTEIVISGAEVNVKRAKLQLKHSLPN